MGEAINITVRKGTTCNVKPAEFLGGSFNNYLDACRKAGASYDANNKCQVARADQLFTLIRELDVAGFAVQITPEAHALLEKRKAEAQAELDRAKDAVAAAEARMKVIDARLAERGQALYGYQRDGVPWLSHRSVALLLDEMGLGKTVQALLAAADDAPMVVVAPAGVKGVWYSESRKWRPELGFPRVLQGRGSFRWPVAGQIVVTNYDILPHLVDEKTAFDGRFDVRSAAAQVGPVIGKLKPGTVLVADECHLLKGHRTKRHRRFKALSRAVRAAGGHVWGLTGTPLLNREDELWHVFDAVGAAGEAFGSRTAFWRAMDSRRRGGTIPMLQKVSLMRRRQDVLADLPVKTYRDVNVGGLTGEALDLANELQAKLADIGIDVATSTAEDWAEAMKHGVVFELISKTRKALAIAKTPAAVAFVEQYEEAGEPALVFSCHRMPVEEVGKRASWAKIDGTTPSLKRKAIEEQLQSGKLNGVAATVKAGGVGLTMTAAHNVIFVDREWTPALNTQAEDRSCRIGQTRGVIVTNLVSDHPVDIRLAELLTQKAALIEDGVNKSAVKTVDALAGMPTEEALGVMTVTADAAKEYAKKAREEAAKPKPPKMQLPNLVAFLRRARDQIATPAVRVEGLQLKVAGRQSKYAGNVMVTNGAGYGSGANQWYGWINSTTNEWWERGKADEVRERLLAYDADLNALIRDCQLWGKETGACSFCSRELTDARSVVVGYGPICAKRYGLEWGDEDAVGTTTRQLDPSLMMEG